jgi:ankyrin repeat protein
VTILALLLILPWPLLYFFGGPLLFRAIQAKDEKIALALVSFNSNWLELKNDQGQKPLDLAILGEMEDLALDFAKKKPNSSLKLNKLYSHEKQAEILEKTPKIISLYLEQNWDMKNVFGSAPISVAIDLNSTTLTTELLKRGCDVNEIGASFTVLDYSVYQDNMEIFKLLLKNGASYSLPGSRFSTLHIAAHVKNKEALNILIREGADVNAKTIENVTPLQMACHKLDKEIVEILLNSGAVVNMRSSTGETPLFDALIGYTQRDNSLPLIKYRVNLSSLKTIVSMLLERGADPNITDKDGTYPLDLALEIRDTELIQLLVRHGARGKHLAPATPSDVAAEPATAVIPSGGEAGVRG